MAIKASSYHLIVSCVKHPEYRGTKAPKKCLSCKLIYKRMRKDKVRLHKNIVMNEVALIAACEGLNIEMELAPSQLEFTTKQVPKRDQCQ